jgi:hypothetical protein
MTAGLFFNKGLERFFNTDLTLGLRVGTGTADVDALAILILEMGCSIDSL